MHYLLFYSLFFVRGGKWSSIVPHFLSIALLDWTIKQKRQNRNMGICVRICSVKCEASHNNIVKVDFFYTQITLIVFFYGSESLFRPKKDRKL